MSPVDAAAVVVAVVTYQVRYIHIHLTCVYKRTNPLVQQEFALRTSSTAAATLSFHSLISCRSVAYMKKTTYTTKEHRKPSTNHEIL